MIEVKANRLDGYKLLHEGTLAFSRAEHHGIRIDQDYCERTVKKLTKRIRRLERQFKQSVLYRHWHHIYKDDSNLYSHPQLAHILYEVKKIKPVKFTKNSEKGSTDDEALTQLNMPVLDPLLRIRKVKNQRDHIQGFLREVINGYVHAFWNLHTVVTYRGSSDRPNLQNIPKHDDESMQICRRAIIPRLGHQIMEPDFSGIEVKVGECYHHDPVMRKYIMDQSTDMHRDMAIELFRVRNYNKKIAGHYLLRQAAKNGFVFPQFYGSYYANCAANLACHWGKLQKGRWKSGQGVQIEDDMTLSDLMLSNGLHSYEQFEQHVKKVERAFWNERFKVYNAWKKRWWQEYQKRGYFELLSGFRCSGIMSEKEVCNYPIQGTAFHCLLWTFIQVDRIARKEKWDSRLIGEIHDSMLIDAKPAEVEHIYWTIQKIATKLLPKHWTWIDVPMQIDFEVAPVDAPWSEKEEFELEEAA